MVSTCREGGWCLQVGRGMVSICREGDGVYR